MTCFIILSRILIVRPMGGVTDYLNCLFSYCVNVVAASVVGTKKLLKLFVRVHDAET